eukprot:COSAG05_NODE_1520_length_4645_cov_613.938187_3_plen_286_part_00
MDQDRLIAAEGRRRRPLSVSDLSALSIGWGATAGFDKRTPEEAMRMRSRLSTTPTSSSGSLSTDDGAVIAGFFNEKASTGRRRSTSSVGPDGRNGSVSELLLEKQVKDLRRQVQALVAENAQLRARSAQTSEMEKMKAQLLRMQTSEEMLISQREQLKLQLQHSNTEVERLKTGKPIVPGSALGDRSIKPGTGKYSMTAAPVERGEERSLENEVANKQSANVRKEASLLKEQPQRGTDRLSVARPRVKSTDKWGRAAPHELHRRQPGMTRHRRRHSLSSKRGFRV